MEFGFQRKINECVLVTSHISSSASSNGKNLSNGDDTITNGASCFLIERIRFGITMRRLNNDWKNVNFLGSDGLSFGSSTCHRNCIDVLKYFGMFNY